MANRKIWSSLGRVALAVIVVFIGILSKNSVTYGQQANAWTDPVALERNGWFPDITTDQSGRIHVAWSNSVVYTDKGSNVRSGYDVVLYTSSMDGVEWEPINEIAALSETRVGNVEVTRPALLVDPSNIFHMTFRDMNVYYANSPVQVASTARYWSKLEMLTTTDLGYFSRLAVDSKGRLHVVYTENVYSSDCLICYHLFYRNSDDGGKNWSSEVDVSTIPTGSAKPQILIDPQDNIHVVWEAGRGGTLGQLTDPTMVMYTVSYNRGDSWSQPLELRAPESVQSKNITIGRDGAGNLVLVWWSLPQDVPYYQTSADNGLSWSDPAVIPNVWGIWQNYQSRLDDYSMVTDSAGNIHLIMVGRLALEDSTLRLLHVTWAGNGWGAPEAIVSYNGDAPEWPRIAISNGNQLNVVWFVRAKDFIWAASADVYKLWYTRRKVDAPYVAPVAYPEFVAPTPTARPTEEARTTVTVDPNLPKLQGTVVVDPKQAEVVSEVDQLTVVGRSVLPALAVVVVLLAVILIRRR